MAYTLEFEVNGQRYCGLVGGRKPDVLLEFPDRNLARVTRWDGNPSVPAGFEWRPVVEGHEVPVRVELVPAEISYVQEGAELGDQNALLLPPG